MVKISAWLAIAVGVAVAAAQFLRNWDNWANWPSWMVDEFAAAVLIAAGLLALRKQTTRLLPVGWSFAAGLYVCAVIGHARILADSTGEHYQGTLNLLVLVSGLLGVTIVGLALVMFGRRNP